MEDNSSGLTENEREEAIIGLEAAAMDKMRKMNKRTATNDVQYLEIETLEGEFDDDEFETFRTYESFADYESKVPNEDGDEDEDDEEYLPPGSKRSAPSPALSKALKRASATPSPALSTASSSTSSKAPKKKDREYEAKVAICAEVRKYPPLYQIIHRDYSNKAAKDAIWEKISASMMKTFGPHMTVKMCHKLWDALRESTR